MYVCVCVCVCEIKKFLKPWVLQNMNYVQYKQNPSD